MIRHHQTGVHRWQEEVARDPGSPAFVPLADLYRAQGRLEVARRVCLRGLERHPNHVEGHYVLGRIYRDGDEPQKAYDEWDIALHLDPQNVASRKAIAFLCLEQGELEEAERHLRHVLLQDADDPRVRRALRYIEGGARRLTPGTGFWEAAARLLEPKIGAFAREARVRLALVLDTSGRIVVQNGFSRELDLAAFASLVVGTHAAAGELARLLEQPRFSQLYQGRGEHQLFVGSLWTPVGEMLLVSVFGEDTNVGLVRSLYREVEAELRGASWPTLASTEPVRSLEAELAEGLRRVGSAAGARGE